MSEKDFNNFSSDENDLNFEDIVSYSTKDEDHEPMYVLTDFASFYGTGKYQKRQRGIKGWWENRKAWQKSAMVAAASLMLILAIVFGTFFTVFDYNYNEIETDDLGFEGVIDEKIVNIALFGIDTRSTKSFKGNSDSIMILSLNTESKTVKVISVMRDSLVPIIYNGKTTYSKINSAYAKGGPELGIKTLNTVFDLDISEYATVNFFGMVDIIDAVGGIDAELTSAEVRPRSEFMYGLNFCIGEICEKMGKDPSKYYITKAGKHHLNGVQAVAYSRIRYVANIWGTSNDYGRTDRQRYVMEQLFNKAKVLDKSQYIKLAKALIPCTETSLSYNDIIELAFSILLKNPTFEQARVPMQEYVMPSPNTSAGSVVYYDLDFVAKLLYNFIYENITPEEYIETNGVEKNDWYRKEVGLYSSGSGSNSNSSSSNTNSSSSISSSSSASNTSSITSNGNSVASKPIEVEPEESKLETSEEKETEKNEEETSVDTSIKEETSKPAENEETSVETSSTEKEDKEPSVSKEEITEESKADTDTESNENQEPPKEPSNAESNESSQE